MKRLKNEINSLVNRGVDRHLRLAVTGVHNSWAPKRENASPNYTGRWEELPVAHC